MGGFFGVFFFFLLSWVRPPFCSWIEKVTRSNWGTYTNENTLFQVETQLKFVLLIHHLNKKGCYQQLDLECRVVIFTIVSRWFPGDRGLSPVMNAKLRDAPPPPHPLNSCSLSPPPPLQLPLTPGNHIISYYYTLFPHNKAADQN